MLAVLIAQACGGGGGGGSNTPTSPTSPGTTVAASYQYAGSVALANGITGLVTVKTFPQSLLARAMDRPSLLEWFLPRLHAQAGTATGGLSLSDGAVVALSGTVSGNSIQMTGAGGYSVTLAVAEGDISGTLVTPQGSGTVGPIARGGSAPSVPSNPAGVYSGTVNLTVNDGYFYNRIISTGRDERRCAYRAVITGTLRLTIFGQDTQSLGRWNAELVENLQYRLQIVPPCPDVTQFESTVGTDPNSTPGRVSIDLSHLQVAVSNQWQANSGSGTELTTFIGAMSGTQVQGRYGKSRRFGGQVVPNNEHWEGWPMTEADVTLVKQ